MGDSNSDWGALATHDDELAEVWDTFAPVPEPGDDAGLDAFVERKAISHGALVRIGARMARPNVLAFAYPGGIKYRNVVDDERWSYAGSTWKQLKIVRHGVEPSDTVIVAEGETDGAWLSDRVPCDVAILPKGADPKPYQDGYALQLAGYDVVLLGQDDDDAGNAGAATLAKLLPQAVRFVPPGGDWCDTDPADLPDIEAAAQASASPENQILVSAGDLLSLEPPELVSWFEGAILPVGGQLVLHGAWKSFKSFLALDMLASLSQGQDWCCFEPTEEACRVAVMQYEIPWAYYRERVLALQASAREPELFASNFLTFTPLRRPTFVAGNVAQEDFILRQLESAAVQVFLLDPIRRATGVADLNSEKDVRPILNFFQRVQDIGVTVVTTHHDNKANVRGGGGDTAGMTGSGAFAGDADTIVSVSLPRGKRLDDPERNIFFLMRNAPAPSPRGMQMTESTHIVYSPQPFGDGLAGDEQPGI